MTSSRHGRGCLAIPVLWGGTTTGRHVERGGSIGSIGRVGRKGREVENLGVMR